MCCFKEKTVYGLTIYQDGSFEQIMIIVIDFGKRSIVDRGNKFFIVLVIDK